MLGRVQYKADTTSCSLSLLYVVLFLSSLYLNYLGRVIGK